LGNRLVMIRTFILSPRIGSHSTEATAPGSSAALERYSLSRLPAA
jgi:hypothetical protein